MIRQLITVVQEESRVLLQLVALSLPAIALYMQVLTTIYSRQRHIGPSTSAHQHADFLLSRWTFFLLVLSGMTLVIKIGLNRFFHPNLPILPSLLSYLAGAFIVGAFLALLGSLYLMADLDIVEETLNFWRGEE